MDALIEKLKNISKTHPINDFKWDDVPDGCPIDIPISQTTGYEKNIYIKDNLYPIISSDQSLDTHYWVIQKWGKIGSFKRNERNDKRINKFINELDKDKLTRDTFGCISSMSKVASFIDPDKYVIYDSRVIYALNWLLFNYTDDVSIFPQPAGRSEILARYDMQTIFRLTKREVEYISYKNAFHEYCTLIKKLTPFIFYDGSRPYKLEMLLFMIAPTLIMNNIEKSVSIYISNIY